MKLVHEGIYISRNGARFKVYEHSKSKEAFRVPEYDEWTFIGYKFPPLNSEYETAYHWFTEEGVYWPDQTNHPNDLVTPECVPNRVYKRSR